MMRAELEARRRALRSEIAVTRMALGLEAARLREDLKWALLASAAVRLVPLRLRWLGVLAGVVAAVGVLRARSGG